jgi:hypothetical protein
MSEAERIARALKGRKSGTGWVAHCPCPNHAHGDKSQSLSIADGRDGKLLIKCFSGGTFDEVMAALRAKGLIDSTPRQMRRDPIRVARSSFVSGKILDFNLARPQSAALALAEPFDAPKAEIYTYPRPFFPDLWDRHHIYTDEAGTPVRLVAIRRNPGAAKKKIVQFGMLPDGTWDSNPETDKGPMVPYRLPELLAAPLATPAFLCEGEKDCDTLANFGHLASTNPNGGASWDSALNKYFAGRAVIVVPDADLAGTKRIADLYGKLKDVAASFKVVSLGLEYKEKHGEDITDWFEKHGRTNEEFIELARKAPEYAPEEGQQDDDQQEDDLEVSDAGEDTEIPEPRQWLLGNQFCRTFLSGLLAPGATGKTALRMLQCMALATARPLTGQHVFKRCRVLIVSLEDDMKELQRRIAAARIHHSISPEELKGWMFYTAPKGLKLAEMNRGTRQIGKLEGMLRRAIDKFKPDLVTLDPFVKLHALEENDNGAMDFVCDLLTKLAIEFNIAVDAPHHTKKGPIAAGNADAGRGASSARDAGRLVYTLTRMTEEEAKAFGIKPEDRALYVRLDNGKVNLAPPAEDVTWFRLVGVHLGNGTDDYPAGDEVQTVVPWHPPKTWEGVSSTQLNAVLTDIDAGMPNGQRYSDAAKADERAAWKVVRRHCPDRTEPQCREIIKTWVKNGVLFNEDYHDPVDRKKTRKGLHLDTSKRPS